MIFSCQLAGMNTEITEIMETFSSCFFFFFFFFGRGGGGGDSHPKCPFTAELQTQIRINLL